MDLCLDLSPFLVDGGAVKDVFVELTFLHDLICDGSATAFFSFPNHPSTSLEEEIRRQIEEQVCVEDGEILEMLVGRAFDHVASEVDEIEKLRKEVSSHAINLLHKEEGGGGELKLIVGDNANSNPILENGWISLTQNILDLTISDDFISLFSDSHQPQRGFSKVSSILGEHVLEHLSIEQVVVSLFHLRSIMGLGGSVRFAVPDPIHKNNSLEADIRDDHKLRFTPLSLSSILKSCGFIPSIVEMMDRRDKEPVTQSSLLEFSSVRGVVSRSSLKKSFIKTTQDPLIILEDDTPQVDKEDAKSLIIDGISLPAFQYPILPVQFDLNMRLRGLMEMRSPCQLYSSSRTHLECFENDWNQPTTHGGLGNSQQMSQKDLVTPLIQLSPFIYDSLFKMKEEELDFEIFMNHHPEFLISKGFLLKLLSLHPTSLPLIENLKEINNLEEDMKDKRGQFSEGVVKCDSSSAFCVHISCENNEPGFK